jgi:hypothetical protein
MKLLSALTLSATLLLCAAPAWADAIDPAEAECQGKAKGDACESGTCQDGECCRNDYSEGTPPKTVCSPCLLCKAGQPAGEDMAQADQGRPAPDKQPEEKDGCAAVGGQNTGMWSLLAGALALVTLRRRRVQVR